MIIKNVTIETAYEYDDNNRYATKELLKLTIPLTGGEAHYKIPLSRGLKDSLEFAAQLSNKALATPQVPTEDDLPF